MVIRMDVCPFASKAVVAFGMTSVNFAERSMCILADRGGQVGMRRQVNAQWIRQRPKAGARQYGDVPSAYLVLRSWYCSFLCLLSWSAYSSRAD